MDSQDRFKSRDQLLSELAAARRRLDELEAEERQRRGTSQREQEAEMHAILDALPDLVIRIHRDGTFLDVKSPSRDILSLPAAEIVGRNIRETGLPPKVTAIHLWNMEAALRARVAQTFEYRLEVPKGLRDFEGRAVACSDDEVLLVIRDITEGKRASAELRRLEAQLHQARRMESLGRLAAGVAHNLNNLLTPIFGYAELLLTGDATPESRQDHLKAILKAASGASELIQQLLNVGRGQKREVRQLDLGQAVADYEPILRRAIHEDIILETRSPRSPVLIEADRSQIEQVLLNLVLNAQDAICGRGRVVVETRSVVFDDGYRELPPGPCGSLRVSDTGTGIDSALREQIFDPFFTTKEEGKGTGLGLASVLGIVQGHRGEIRLESAVGEGSTFEILLPLCTSTVEREDEVTEAAAIQDRQETVLVVEDDKFVNRLVSQILREHGYLVLTAPGGEACLHLIEQRSGPIDLLLTDVVMPQINGRELYKRLRLQLPDLKVLYMSGYADDVVADHGVYRDRMHLVQKPFSIPRLLHEVGEALATTSEQDLPTAAFRPAPRQPRAGE